MAEWTCDSNEALTLSLTRAREDQRSLHPNEDYLDFHPSFTYPIYGEDEKIYGYKNLVIDLRFASGSLVQYLSVKSTSKLPTTSSTVDDVEGTLSKFIPPDYYRSEAEFEKRVEEDALNFKPLGERIHTYTRTVPGGAEVVEYEVYHATWDTPGFKEYHRRMQLFILLYIEAGSYINDEEPPWEFVVLYEKRKRQGTTESSYHFVGYSSLYNFYCFPEKVRMRLSQFVILPPYQRQRHGSALYTAIYNLVLCRPDIAELTVEDPAEAFEDLRDRNDLRMLLGNEIFMKEGFGEDAVSHGGGRVLKGKGKVSIKGKGKMGPPADKAWVERWRREMKIAGRQFQRLIEMLALLRLDPSDGRMMRAYRLQVKERLYRFNFEVLVQLDKQERLDKLEETFQSVIEDYGRILDMVR